MIKGIAIVGLNGGGKSTLSHTLAKRLNYYELDLEDCYFPEQKDSRMKAIEGNSIIDTDHSIELPFSNPRTKKEVESIIVKNIKTNPKFIITGVTMNWSEEILSKIDIVFFVQTPLKERLNRIQKREERRFGPRVLEGGDMYEQQIAFCQMVKMKDIKDIEASLKKFKCPIIEINGTLPVTHNIQIIMDNLKKFL